MSADGQIVRNATYIFAGSVVADIAAFLFRLVVARGFGPEGFGLFSLALMTMTIATSISLFGLPDGIVTFVSRLRSQGKPNHIAGVLLSSFVTAGVVSIVVAATIWALASTIAVGLFDTAELVPLLRTFAFGVPARVIIALTAALFLGFERGGVQSILKRIFPKLGIFGAAAVVVFVDGTLQNLVAAYVIVLWATAGTGILVGAVLIRGARIDGVVTQTRDLFEFSTPLLFTGFVAFFLNWTDAALIGYFLDSDDVGIYQAAFVLGTNIAVFHAAISRALYPNFGSLVAEENIEKLQNQFVQGTQWIVIFTLAPSTYLIAFSEMSIEMTFGTDFAGGVNPLIILVTGQLFASALAISTNVLKATKNSRYIFLTYTGALLVNLMINIILIPRIGILGAAIGTITARSFANALHYRWVRRRFDVHLPIKTVGKVLIGAGVTVIFTTPLKSYVTTAPRFLAHIGVFSILYCLGMIKLGIISTRDIRRFVIESVPYL